MTDPAGGRTATATRAPTRLMTAFVSGLTSPRKGRG